MIGNLDTSAMVKLVVPEAGTGETRRLWAASRIHTCP